MDESLGRMLYDQSKTVVCLRLQGVDPGWHDLLQHVQNGSCYVQHTDMLCSLVITNPACPPTDFQHTWNDTVIITPRRAVRHQWNAAKTRAYCKEQEEQPFIYPAYDTIHGQRLTLSDWIEKHMWEVRQANKAFPIASKYVLAWR